MRKIILWNAVFLMCGLTICSASNIPGETSANIRGQKSILEQIQWLHEATNVGHCLFEVIDTKRGVMEFDTVIEYWTVKSCDQIVIYKIRVAPLSSGTVKYSVTYPMPNELLP